MTAPKLKIEYLPVSGLVPYARNARTHSPAQVSQLAASIREFGFTNPVLVDPDGGIVAGHGRVLAAIEVGLAQVPALRLGWLTEAQRRAYVLADNRLAEGADWDLELVREELEALRVDGFDIGLTGFGDFDFGAEPAAGGGPPGPAPDPLAGYKEQYGVIVICRDAAHQEAIYNELKEAGHDCRVVVT